MVNQYPCSVVERRDQIVGRRTAPAPRMHTPHTMPTQAPASHRLTQATRRVSSIHSPGMQPRRVPIDTPSRCPAWIGPLPTSPYAPSFVYYANSTDTYSGLRSYI